MSLRRGPVGRPGRCTLRCSSAALRALRALRALGVLCVLAGLGACGVPEQGTRTIDRGELPASLRETSTTTTIAPGTDVAFAAVHWIRDGQLVQESVLFESGPDVGRLLALLERGPASDGAGATTRSAISDSGAVISARQRGDTVVVELDELAGPDQVLAIGQVVMTLTSLPGVRSVRFVRDGETVEVPLPDGTLVRRPLTSQDYASLLASP